MLHLRGRVRSCFSSFFKVYIEGPGLSMVGVLKAPKFGYVPELLKKHCQ